MKKFLRYLFQYAILAVAGFFVYQTAFKREAPPAFHRDQWTQREGFMAISYGGLSLDEGPGTLTSKNRLREQLSALAAAGYRTITTKDVKNFYDANGPLPDKALYLMFEGGRKDSVLFSQPILVHTGYNASLYLYGDRLTGWSRFFVRSDELRKVAANPFWDVGSMGFHSKLINETPKGGYAYYLTARLAAGDGKPEETPEGFDARVAADYKRAYASIADETGKPPLGYVFMPANTLGVSLPPAIAKPNDAGLARFFPVAFTRVGESYNSRQADSRRLTRLQVDPTWSPDRLLLEIESRLPQSSFLDFSNSVLHGLWQVGAGAITANGQALTLAAPAGKDGFALLRGTEGFENFLCRVKVVPARGGAALIYLRYRDSGSYVRIQVTADQVIVREKNGHALNTLVNYVLPVDQTGPVALDCCVKNNRLLMRVGGKEISPYPIPLTAGTERGSFALGALGDTGGHKAAFSDLRLTAFPPRWLAAPALADASLDNLRTLTAMVLPAKSLTDDPVANAAALVTVAASGVVPFLNLSETDPAKVEAMADSVASAPASLIIAKLLGGFVLSLEDFPDDAVLARLEKRLRKKGFAVALRVTPASKNRLLAAEKLPRPDWLLFDMPPLSDAGDMTRLANRFDKSRMLFRTPGPDPEGAIYYDVKG
ncbi:conserved hypothetical protein [Solidesulfovibrio fructosivorans JJ]]|uniref:Polysaccharide deacetylase n=1 Tax=Solidesulfovibrio fructosivorans JJ] TaxID=596151 RepID=E1JYF7_SOLFR|nr:hypothetical protein [Solidesulfovibrio fructosivorans]EFL50541.1 conserved hypothetical protein [Solidesulfovibrio fructosivorans JJ]]